MEDDDALAALQAHNRQLARLLTREGRAELDRMALLELALHAHVHGRLQEVAEAREPVDERAAVRIADRLMTELEGVDQRDAERLAADIVVFIKVPGSVKDLGRKVGSVANAYVKKKVGGVLDEDDDG